MRVSLEFIKTVGHYDHYDITLYNSIHMEYQGCIGNLVHNTKNGHYQYDLNIDKNDAHYFTYKHQVKEGIQLIKGKKEN